MKSLDNRALFVCLILISVLPRVLDVLEIRSAIIGLTCFAVNMAICAAGYVTGRYRTFWVVWAATSVIAFLLLSIINPLSMIIVLVPLLPPLLKMIIVT